MMLPFYFLSIMFNAVTGIILAFRGEETLEESGFSFSLDNEVFRLMLGAASVFTGFLKLLSPVAGNIPVIGDLIPALANLAGGAILVFEYYRNRSTLNSDAALRLGETIGKIRKLAGFAAIAAAAIHFICYPIPLL
jgi:hypothetical protein